MQSDTPSAAAEGRGGKLPADIWEAIREVVATQQAFGAVEGPDKARAAIKASFACGRALVALEAAILSHLPAGREALSREKE